MYEFQCLTVNDAQLAVDTVKISTLLSVKRDSVLTFFESEKRGQVYIFL